MTVKYILLLFILNLIMAFLLNNIFLLNQTSYLLITSIFAFIGIPMMFFLLELEFIAIGFSMVYVGGITAMFLFLILVVDVNIENVEGPKLININWNICVFISAFSIMFSIFLLSNLNILMFNTINFLALQDEYYECAFKFISNTTLDEVCFVNSHLFSVNLVDIWVLSVVLFKSFYIYLILIATFLTVAIIVSLIFCSNPFEKYWNIRF